MTFDLKKAYLSSSDQVVKHLEVDPQEGLRSGTVRKRLKKYGRNQLREAARKSGWLIFFHQFKSLIVILLALAAILSLAFHEWMDAIAIFVVILFNALIGFFTEIKAVRSMEALRNLTRVNCRVRRNGHVREISAVNLVPGDVVILEGGDVVTADMRLLEASKLQVNESSLTGESVPVEKRSDIIEEETVLAERSNMLFKGTAITRGSAVGVVTGTGMDTELGRISALVEAAEEERTPLEVRLDQLGHNLIWVTLVLTVIVAGTGILRGKETFLMISTAIALAVAAIPEGLPIVATIALARGMLRMARRNALINRLASVETLGATSIICTDKTGTLTENRMTVQTMRTLTDQVDCRHRNRNGKKIFKEGDSDCRPLEIPAFKQAVLTGLLCNNAALAADDKHKHTGDPLEIALLQLGRDLGIEQADVLKENPRVGEEAFDAESKMMATLHRADSKILVAVKGAPETVLEASSRVCMTEGSKTLDADDKKAWSELNHKMAEEGYRVLAMASKTVDDTETNPYENLQLTALIGLVDPPRGDVAESIQTCQQAGIRVVMVTGDQPVTARKVAGAVGLAEPEEIVVEGKDLRAYEELSDEERRDLRGINIYARVDPEQKLDIIQLHQDAGAIVAMTGDGVNDAPALKKADIGVAMGLRGTQVARETADMVLKDDAFATIVAAIQQGRIIFNNIRKFVVYLLSCNISEIIVVAVASFIKAPMPLLPLQILFLNLVTDIFPALALGMGAGDRNIMDHPPRDAKEAIVTRPHWLFIIAVGLLLALSVLSAFSIALFVLKMEEKQAITVSFLTLAFAQLWHVFNMRDNGSSLLRNDIVRNPYVWGAVALCVMLLLAAISIPVLSGALKIAMPDATAWALILGMSLVPFVVIQVYRSLRRDGRNTGEND
ncbi:cation-transporting P-type ATPase [candidate division KSB1 bacterium]|nr:cation-transporting P-type ATPase [candidate division KSB1 bacterium]